MKTVREHTGAIGVAERVRERMHTSMVILLLLRSAIEDHALPSTA